LLNNYYFSFGFFIPFFGIFTIRMCFTDSEGCKKIIAFIKGVEYLGDEEVILQKNRNDCGVAALKMIFDHFEIPVSYEEICEKVLEKGGSTMLSLKRMANSKGLKVEGFILSFEDLRKVKLPAITFVNGKHYVVISKITEDRKIIVLDPSIGKLKYSFRQFQRIWKGYTLIFYHYENH